MRKVIVNNIVSVDGFYSAADGNPLVLNMDAAFDRENLASIEAAGTVLLGRNSFEGFSQYWPFVADAPAAEDPESPEGRALDDVNRAISRRYSAVPKVVVSDQGAVPAENAWHDSTTVIGRSEALDWIAAERLRGEGDIAIFASRTLWNVLAQAGVIDELRIMISPDALGVGVPLWDSPMPLELLEARTFEDSGNVQLRYAPRA
ncbi:dihydrofolate reductase family protein [Microbacterium sp. EST19A]|uniref:dihydrofolate reductase family protein n=1 Tax=Microbacterium sp. EST19A TaxID=2862681 RepID=UPI001CC0F30D|nr:dihydrofolate reductase family protein [Microbacterium sp. EST19A]